jgi:sensor domain CHASE-containing protein
MELKKRQQRSDLLEVGIVLALLFLVITIYVPVAIWEEEKVFEDESRFRMQNLYDIEEFHNQLTGLYNTDFYEAMGLVNAARDSVIADSNFIKFCG